MTNKKWGLPWGWGGNRDHTSRETAIALARW